VSLADKFTEIGQKSSFHREARRAIYECLALIFFVFTLFFFELQLVFLIQNFQTTVGPKVMVVGFSSVPSLPDKMIGRFQKQKCIYPSFIAILQRRLHKTKQKNTILNDRTKKKVYCV
jgi:hypothetical protein